MLSETATQIDINAYQIFKLQGIQLFFQKFLSPWQKGGISYELDFWMDKRSHQTMMTVTTGLVKSVDFGKSGNRET